ncbi:hypothetical protein HAX54_005475 [Datura stramonium]|uniref:Uncharacterized protein n=1 Tax=Datura stramonium TaxID=4076 RepID=A0ABS8WVZ4_DATST|nr:hypothetical protein [Datura stramonium]
MMMSRVRGIMILRHRSPVTRRIPIEKSRLEGGGFLPCHSYPSKVQKMVCNSLPPGMCIMRSSFLREKGIPTEALRKSPGFRINAPNEVLVAQKSLRGLLTCIDGQDSRKYNIEMVREFYANYYYTHGERPSKNAIKKEPMLDSSVGGSRMGHKEETDPQGFHEFFVQVIVVHRPTRLTPIVNDNVLSADKVALVACIMSEYR